MTNSCPPREALVSYLRGTTSVAESEIVEIHLGGCETCQALVELLADESDSLMQTIASVAKARMVMGSSYVGLSGAEVNQEAAVPRSSYVSPPIGRDDGSTMIRDYRILECIGTGGMGSVYRALHVRLDKQVALKVLKSERMTSPEAISRFAREMKLLARLEHAHIVKALDAGEQDGLPYFVMEFVGGLNLHQLVRRLGPLPVQDACHIVSLAASALHYAHEQKVIHRDVKPSNLMLTPEGNVKLLDLGLAQILGMEGADSLSRADQVLGTVDYMAPEQLTGRHQVTSQSDIFSLGVTLHELLTGLRPSRRLGLPPQAADIQAIRPDVDQSLLALVGDMMAITPSKRPLTMADVELRLKAISAPSDLSNLVAEYYRWSGRHRPEKASEFARADTEASAARSTDRTATSRMSSLVALLTLPPWKHAGIMQIAPALVLATCIIAIGWIGMTQWPRSTQVLPIGNYETQKPVMHEPAEKLYRVQVTGDGDFVLQLLERGAIRLEDNLTGEIHELVNGAMELPAGKYTLRYDAPVGFQADGTVIDIAPAKTQTLRIEAQLTELFQYPILPDVGGRATYYGELWHSGWGKDHKRMAYTLELEVLAVEDKPDKPLSKWLLVQITDDGRGYIESAYIKVDVKVWENLKQLEIVEGWIEAKSPEIKRFLEELELAENGHGLVVPFDRQRDLLSAVKGLELPKQRLSVQDAIALFFADRIPVAAVPILTARQNLSAVGRNEWLGPAKSPYGKRFCYVISSRTQDDLDSVDGYRIARSKSDSFNPFGIVEIQVKIPTLDATCTMKDGLTAKPDAERVARKLEDLKIDAATQKIGIVKRPATRTRHRVSKTPLPFGPLFDELGYQIGTLALNQGPIEEVVPPDNKRTPAGPDAPSRKVRSTPGRFDLASIPEGLGYVKWQGNISHGPNRIETITSTARMLQNEVIDGKVYRWIEVTSSSVMQGAPDYWEGARLLVDATTYGNSSLFSIKQGWIAYNTPDNVFQIPESGNLEELIGMRLLLQQQPQVDRVNIIDVLSMLFDANLQPSTPISNLRAFVSASLAGSKRQSVPHTMQMRNETIAGERWMSDPIPTLNYTIFKSPQVPFGFAYVKFNVGTITINLEMVSKSDSVPVDYATTAFGNPTELLRSFNKNIASLPAHPNLRVWTWSVGKRKYMACAEYGGTINNRTGRDVLLRNEQGTEVCVPERSLAKTDQEYLLKGRLWASFKNERRVLLEDRGTELAFLLSNGTEQPHVGGLANKFDQAWLEGLRAAIKRKATSVG